MRLDRHSTLLTKYALMGVFLYGVVVNTVYAQEQDTIYHRSSSMQPSYTKSCDIEAEMNQAFNDFRADRTESFRNWRDDGSYVQSHPTSSVKCVVRIVKRADKYRRNSDGNWERWGDETYQYVSQRDGRWITAEQCPPEGTSNPDDFSESQGYTIFGPDLLNPEADTSMCYDATELAEKDTCETLDGINESHFSSTQGLSCVALDDGSQCPIRSSGSIEGATSTTFFYKHDDSVNQTSCYATETVDDATSGQIQTDESNCIGSFCPAPPDKYLDQSGNAPPGCGEINGNFYCTAEKIQEVENRDPVQEPHTPEEPGTEEPGTEEPGTEEPGTGEPGTGEGTVNLSNIESFLAEITGTTAATRDKVAELNQTVEDTFTVNQSAKGKLPTDEESLNEIAQAEQKLQEKIQEVKTYFTTLFSVQSGAGQFSGCYDILSMKGQTHSACVDEYSDSMNLVSLALLFIFGLISVVILLR